MSEATLGLWILAGALGFLVGLRYRVPAVIAASGAVAIAGAVLANVVGTSGWGILGASVGAVVALQLGYLCGVVVMFLCAMGARASVGASHDRGDA